MNLSVFWMGSFFGAKPRYAKVLSPLASQGFFAFIFNEKLERYSAKKNNFFLKNTGQVNGILFVSKP